MNIAYPITEILTCVEIINQPKKKLFKNDDKTFSFNNNASMKKKIKQTQGTFGEIIETEELIEETFDDAKPFEIEEITIIKDYRKLIFWIILPIIILGLIYNYKKKEISINKEILSVKQSKNGILSMDIVVSLKNKSRRKKVVY